MPGAVIKIDKLQHCPAALYQQVRRHLHAANLIEIGMLIPIEAVGKKALYAVSAVAARRQ